MWTMRGDLRSRTVEKVSHLPSLITHMETKRKRITTFIGRRVGGLSFKIRSVLEMDAIDDVRLEDLEDPCGNCREELKQCNAGLDQFRVDLMVKGNGKRTTVEET